MSPQQSSFGGMNDAFGGLSFSNPTSPPVQAKPNAFANLGNLGNKSSQKSPPFSGGSFFDAKPAQKPVQQQPPQVSRGFSSSSGFGAFDSAPGVTPAAANSSSGMGDMFDFSSDFSTPAPAPPPKQTVVSPPAQQSVFNLSQPTPAPKAAPTVAATTGWGNDAAAWGSSNEWNTPQTSPPIVKAAPPQASTGDFGWGSASGGLSSQSIVPGGSGFTTTSKAQPQISADEDFGGWSSAAPVTPAVGVSKPAKGFAASEDPFANVWE